jgi:hypothetical protein
MIWEVRVFAVGISARLALHVLVTVSEAYMAGDFDVSNLKDLLNVCPSSVLPGHIHRI